MAKAPGVKVVPRKRAAAKKRVGAKNAANDPILKGDLSRPTASDLYYWCDYIELKCLADADHRCARGKILELLDDSAQLHGDITDADDTETGDAYVTDDDQLDEFEDEDGLGGAPVSSIRMPPSVEKEAKVATWYANLVYRSTLFGEAYPFEVSGDGQELFLRPIDSKARELYLQLLLSSSLRLIPKTRRDELTEPFEELSHLVFSKLMPAGWEVHRFGAKGATRFKGTLFSRLQKLASDLRSKLDLEARHFKTGNSGDGGLDLVAWHPLGGDTRVGLPIAFAQCGCTADEWSKKSLEASPAALRPHLKAHHPWATYYFMPHDLVEGVGELQDWQRRPKITESIVIDRLRLIRLATQYGIVAECANAPSIVTEAAAMAM